MGRPIEITRGDLSAEQLRAMAGKTSDGAIVRRLLAIALLLDGGPRERAATLNGMTRQTLRDWVHRYNDLDVAGLRSRTGPGRPPRLTPARMEEFREIVATGPDPERYLVARWCCADLREELAARFSVTVCEQTVGRWLRCLGMTRLQPRPVAPKKDPEAETDFKKLRHIRDGRLAGRSCGQTHRNLVPGRSPGRAERFAGIHLGAVGSRPRAVRDNRHDLATCSARCARIAPLAPPSSCPRRTTRP